MPDFDLSAGFFGLPWWAAAALVAVVVLLAVITLARGSGWSQSSSTAVQLGVLLAGGFLGLSLLDRMMANDAAAERRAFEQRLAELDNRALAAGSPLGCLHPVSGDVVAGACEEALFASPQTVAAATSYVAARLALLRQVSALARGRAGLAELQSGLRRFAENDRFGFVAQVLSVRDQCTAEQCSLFALLQSPERVIANMKDRTYEVHVGRHVASWRAQDGAPALASAAPEAEAGAEQTTVNIDFPSAASIPPVSIMNNEPGMPGQNGMGRSPAIAPAPGLAPGAQPAAAEAPRSEPPAQAPRTARPRAATPTPVPRRANRPAPEPEAAVAAPQQLVPQQQ